MRRGKLMGVLMGFFLLLGLQGLMTPALAHAAGEHDAPPAQPLRILVLGDSLSAEYGLPRGTGWVHIMEQRLAQRGQEYQIRNASISGDTTGNGLQRVPRVLEEFPADILIIQLGANDGLRGLPLADMESNLRKMMDLAIGRGMKVLLVGQRIPPNYGKRYAEDFHAVYARLAKEYETGLVPFMLESIALDAGMFQADGLHPTMEAQPIIADTIWPHLEALLRAA